MTRTMTAALLREHGDVSAINLEQVPVPKPSTGEVRLQVHACALNWLDIGVRRGPKFGPVPLPLICGGDIAGVVESLGPGVERWRLGDEVIVYPLISCGNCEACRDGEPTTCPEHRIIGEHLDGGLAEFIVVPADNLLSKPHNLSLTEAATLPVVLMTSWHMLVHIGDVKRGEDVLILGAGGGVASMSIQVARHLGARVFATTSTSHKAASARNLGAAEVFDYRQADWGEGVRSATEGRGVDLVQDNVGAATWASGLSVLASNGRLVSCGSHTGATTQVEIPQIYHRQLRILGSNGGTYEDLVSGLSLVNEGHIRPVIDSILPLGRIREAHRLLEDGRHFGKIVIEVV
ncbi:MAG: zinc-binding dehydrogenase [Gemmatimonadales bacterium]